MNTPTELMLAWIIFERETLSIFFSSWIMEENLCDEKLRIEF